MYNDKKTKINIGYIVCFIALLWLPILIYPAINKFLDHTNYENRSLTTWEDVRNSSWDSLFPNVEQFIQDNVFYKNECVKTINAVDEKIFQDPFNKKVVVGKDNWLFYKGEGCIQDYRGGVVLSEEDLKAYADAAVKLKKSLNDQGVELCLMITPNKEAIYGEQYLPNKVKRISNESRADQIVKYITENTNCTVVYPKNALQNAADKYQVWRKYDTHWNEIGAFVSSQEFLKAEGVTVQTLSDVEINEAGYCSGDLANMLGKGAVLTDDIMYAVDGYLDDIESERVENQSQPNLNFSKFISNGSKEQTVLFIGDSFLGSMEGYIARNYTTCLFIHRDNYTLLDRDLFTSEKPDLVVLQTAERFLDSYDDWCNVYAVRFNVNEQ